MLEKLSLPIAIVVAGGIIGGALYYSNVRGAREAAIVKAIVPSYNSDKIRPVSAEDHILGDPNADVIIVEYSDLECPYCKDFQSTLKRVMSEYGKDGKVAWVYRHFPISDLHKKAEKEAEASECVNELGGSEKFWEYINLVYETTSSNDSLDPAQLPILAAKVGITTADFKSCLSSGRYAAKVKADYDDAVKAGGQGTPHSVLVSKDGTLTTIQGAWPYDNLKEAIDALLKS